MSDFKKAFSIVGPSMQRGFQVQVEKMTWNDVGGLEQVKKVQTCTSTTDSNLSIRD